MKILHCALAVAAIANSGICAQGSTPATTPTSEELRLIELVNQYRKENGKDTIPASLSLIHVAEQHVLDLMVNDPVTTDCNLHSWSGQGSWTECCYTSDHANAECMWSKPSELTAYPGNGYEDAYMSGADATAEGALASWKTSSGHNDVILSNGVWASHPWKAIGAGILGHYAVLWFGEEDDPAGSPVQILLDFPKGTAVSSEMSRNYDALGRSVSEPANTSSSEAMQPTWVQGKRNR